MRFHFTLIGSLALAVNLIPSTADAQPGDCCAPHWVAVPSGGLRPLVINDLIEADLDGDGEATLYAAGSFAGGTTVASRVNGEWIGVPGSPTGGYGHELAVFDDGGGPALYAGGRFSSAGGMRANNIAKWDGRAWSALDGGLQGQPPNQGVFALAVFDDGSGAALYAGGIFDTAGGAPARAIARWNGQAWSEVGSGFAVKTWDGVPIVLSMLAFPHHGREALFVGGNFSHAGGVPTQALVAWDGTTWSHIDVDPLYDARSMVVWRNAQGADVLAVAGIVGVGVWDGASFDLLGQLPLETARDLAAFDDGIDDTPALYVTRSGAPGLARWDGVTWEPQPGTFSGGSEPYAPFTRTLEPALVPLEPGARPALYVGGDFFEINDQPSAGLGLWAGAPTMPVQGDANDDCCVNADDLTAVILAWGECPATRCPTDFDDDADTDVDDLVTVIINWSP